MDQTEKFKHLMPIFESQKFIHHLGVEITDLEEGYCEMTLDFHENWSQKNGFFHGGIVGTLADTVATAAAATLLKQDERCLTAEYKINLLAPAKGEKMIATGKILKFGRSLKVVEANVYVLNGTERRHCAMALVTLVAA